MFCCDRAWARAGVALLIALLAACQPVPQPNRPDSKSREFGGLLDLGPRAGFTVAPVGGLQGDLGARFAEALAVSLQGLDVAASARKSHRASYLLTGQVRALPPERGLRQIAFDWRIVDPRGLEVAKIDQIEILQEGQWPPSDGARLRALAAASAERVGRIVGLDPEIPAPTTGGAIAIEAVTGAPGDGNRALAAAMRRALRGQGARIAETGADAAFTLRGVVRVGDFGRDRQKVEIDWMVYRLDGEEIGTSSQANLIPLGALDARWGSVAEAAAEAGAEGVLQIVKAATPRS